MIVIFLAAVCAVSYKIRRFSLSPSSASGMSPNRSGFGNVPMTRLYISTMSESSTYSPVVSGDDGLGGVEASLIFLNFRVFLKFGFEACFVALQFKSHGEISREYFFLGYLK